jgi:preprotein translocase subunit YajC
LQGYFFILILLALMWFLLIRPQRRRQLEAQKMINSLEVGKEIVTAGGLYGTITDMEDDELHVEIADGVEVRIAKRAVAAVVTEEEEPEEPEESEETEAEEAPEEETPATLRQD